MNTTRERPVDRAREQVAAAAESLTAAMESAEFDQVPRLQRAVRRWRRRAPISSGSRTS